MAELFDFAKQTFAEIMKKSDQEGKEDYRTLARGAFAEFIGMCVCMCVDLSICIIVNMCMYIFCLSVPVTFHV